MPDATDQSHCPHSGKANECGMENGQKTCWCFSDEIPAEVIEREPPAARKNACVCQTCAAADRNERKLRVAGA
jgi:hypothetical protein